eukprot:TRINITY_DN47644_c0_g1_i1.p1 TRINITY_DN47644_c0_g1~~TRINITY_DN47644_c0_g1_i1.p1  ORF type:complete len:388 (-),score=174.46 TRINITY_DN47644_c0_g1_i1:49-1212(-)
MMLKMKMKLQLLLSLLLCGGVAAWGYTQTSDDGVAQGNGVVFAQTQQDDDEALASEPSLVLTFGIGGMVACLTFGLGATLSIENALVTLRRPLAPIVGVVSQFGFMPLVAFSLAKIFGFGPYKALGLLLTGASPGGSTSNLMTYLSKGDVALSITMTVFSNIISFGMIPLMLLIYVPLIFEGSSHPELEIPFLRIFLALCFVLFPTMCGIYLRHKSERLAKRAEQAGTVVGIIFLVGALGLGIAENTSLLKQSAATWVASATLQLIGYGLGYAASYVAGLPKKQRVTVAFEVFVQNTPLSITIVTFSFRGVISNRQMNEALIFPLLCSFWDVFNSIVLAAGVRYLMHRRGESDLETYADEQERQLELKRKLSSSGFASVQLTEEDHN